MKSLGMVIKHVDEEQDARQLLDKKIFDAIKKAADELMPHVKVLSGGQMRKEGGGRLNAYRVAPIERVKAEAAAKYAYE